MAAAQRAVAAAKVKKAGLPVWAWGAIAVGGLAAFLLFRARSGSTDGSSSANASPVLAGGQVGPIDAAQAGQPSQNAAPASQLDPSVLDALASIGDKVSSLGDTLAANYVYTTPSENQAAASGQASAAGTASVTSTPTQTVVQVKQAAPTAATGVKWGGQTFFTKASLRSWLSARGASYDTWAKNHPTAAATLR